MTKFLVIDDEPADLALLQGLLEKQGHEVFLAKTAAEGLDLVRRVQPGVAILDILLPDENGLEVYSQMRALDGKLPIIFATASGSSNTAIEAMQLGALDYLTKPLNVAEVKRVVERALEVRRMANDPVTMDPSPASPSDGDVIIGRSPAMQEVYKSIGLVAAQDVTVLIRGESGTGKELVARAIYQYSDRSDGPFLAVNCAAIPENLLESELFGHEKGAFTGADKRRVGKFEQCNGGTLFLDEIGDMPLILQSKILRVLQDQTFERVGGNQTIKTDVRVINATHRDLESMVAKSDFREDLLYRLNGYTITLPPLRDRGEDIDLLVEHFRKISCHDLDKQVRGVSSDALSILRKYHWPGNVRELQNVIRQAILKTNGAVLLPDFLPEHIRRRAELRETAAGQAESHLEDLIDERLRSNSGHVYDEVVGEVERQLIHRALHASGGDKLEAIRLLGINPASFRSTAALQLLELDPPAAKKDDSENTEDKENPEREGVAGGAGSAGDLIRVGMTMEEIEREAIRRALIHTSGKRTDAAQMLGVSVRTLQRKIKEYELN